MNEIDPPDWTFIERVARGRATAAEWAAVDEWVGIDQERRALVDDVRRIVRAARAMPVASFDAPARLAELHARLDLAASTPRPARPPRRSVFPHGPVHARGWWWSRAAALIIGVVASAAITSRMRRAPQASHTYVTARGELGSFMLPDGSRVVLAPASHLTVGASFGDHDRTVTLDGEGFFAVLHDPSKPFTVRTTRLVVTDVGTSFDIQAYAADSAEAVSVHDGQLSLGVASAPKRQTVALTPGYVATVRSDRPVLVVKRTTRGEVGSWTAGRLEFRSTPLRDVVRAVSRWYDADVELGDSSLAERPLTASFGNEPIADVLLILTRSTRTRVVHRGTTVLLLPAP